MHPSFDRIPQELRERAQWVVWRKEHRNGRLTKVPYNAAGGTRASTTDPDTWTTFEMATAASDRFDGMGFVFHGGDPYCGVDLDSCIDAHGDLHPAAAAIVEGLDSYAECSPSGTGMHVIFKGKLHRDRHRTKDTPWGGDFEVYDRDRFFTVTGNGSGEIGERQDQLDVLVADMFPPTLSRSSPRANGHVTVDDRELLRRAFAARNGAKLRALYGGDTTYHGGDDSAADLALCIALAFWTGPDADRLDRLFRGSGLYREKWDEGRGDSTYGRQTIEKSLQRSTSYHGCSTASSDRRNSHAPDHDKAADEVRGVIIRAGDVRSKRVRWAWKGYLPLGYLTIQSGESKLGKSTFVAYVTAQITQGRLLGEFYGQPVPVLILACEDGLADLWKPRLVAAGADLDLVAFLDIPDGWNVRDGLSLIARGLEMHPARIVVVDAVMEHLPGARGSENANSVTFVRGSLRPFANLCQQRGVAGVISTHPPKGLRRQLHGRVLRLRRVRVSTIMGIPQLRS